MYVLWQEDVFKVSIGSHCDLTLWGKQPYDLDIADSFWSSHILSVALSNKWYIYCLFAEDRELLRSELLLGIH